jgi:signal peptidase
MKLSRNQREVAEFVVAIVAAWLVYNGLGLALGTSMPMVAVVSGSMEPNLHVGDLMIVRAQESYSAGDIAIYNRGRITIIHRIVDITPQGYVFKGDNNPAPDPDIVPPERVLGRGLFAIPLLGYPRLLLFAVGI